MATQKKPKPPKPTSKAYREAAAVFGSIGGAAGRGESKRRSKEFYQEIGRAGALARHEKAMAKKAKTKKAKK